MEKLQINIPKGFMIDEAKSDLANGIVEFKEIKVFDYKDIKSYGDACERLGYKPEFNNSDTNDEIAYKMLKHVYKAINNGWIPDYSNVNQYKYYPYFEFQQTRGASEGFGFSYCCYDYGVSRAAVSSCLCTDSSEKAVYIGKQFEGLYNIFLLSKKKFNI